MAWRTVVNFAVAAAVPVAQNGDVASIGDFRLLRPRDRSRSGGGGDGPSRNHAIEQELRELTERNPAGENTLFSR